MTSKFTKFNIAFAPVYNLTASVREKTSKEWASLGIGGGMTLLNGEIIIIILPRFFENFDKTYSDRLFKRFVAVISEIIGHESIHREQLKRMSKKYLDELAKGKGATVGTENMGPYEYYGNPQEISAFANQAIDDLVRHQFRESTIKDFLKNPTDWLGKDEEKWATEKNFKKFSMAYILYYQLFKYDEPDIWHKFEKQLYYFLEKVKY